MIKYNNTAITIYIYINQSLYRSITYIIYYAFFIVFIKSYYLLIY